MERLGRLVRCLLQEVHDVPGQALHDLQGADEASGGGGGPPRHLLQARREELRQGLGVVLARQGDAEGALASLAERGPDVVAGAVAEERRDLARAETRPPLDEGRHDDHRHDRRGVAHAGAAPGGAPGQPARELPGEAPARLERMCATLLLSRDEQLDGEEHGQGRRRGRGAAANAPGPVQGGEEGPHEFRRVVLLGVHEARHPPVVDGLHAASGRDRPRGLFGRSEALEDVGPDEVHGHTLLFHRPLAGVGDEARQAT
mmetsp:Transcript_93429/g.264515  ORF Transcript_93429/g.264515 Transcript_93429/m.264515 type:complete len:259 (-) Transcript_93429:2080-2856(-)